MNKYVRKAARIPDHAPSAIPDEDRQRMENRLIGLIEVADSEAFEVVKDEAKALIHDCYIALKDEENMLYLGRMQGFIAGLEALLDTFQGAKRDLETLKGDIGETE